MLSTGTYKIANILTPERIFTFIHKEYTVEQHINELEKMKDRRFIAITSGVRLQDREKTIEVISKFPDIGIINVDIANVYANMQGMVDTIKLYREKFPHIQKCAGNVATVSPIQKFVKAGATLIKVGVGSGAACRTRSEVGTGVPQLSAIMDCYTEAQKYGVGIISDGGCVTAGDVCKAIGAGAKMVMVAGMVSKSEECDNIVEIDGKKYVNFYGLGSTTMYNRTKPTEQEYRPNEGRDLLIPCKGSITSILKQIQGGLRSVCTYVGAENITQLYKRTTFVRVNNQLNNSLARYEQ
jgi:GMP reductase